MENIVDFVLMYLPEITVALLAYAIVATISVIIHKKMIKDMENFSAVQTAKYQLLFDMTDPEDTRLSFSRLQQVGKNDAYNIRRHLTRFFFNKFLLDGNCLSIGRLILNLAKNQEIKETVISCLLEALQGLSAEQIVSLLFRSIQDGANLSDESEDKSLHLMGKLYLCNYICGCPNPPRKNLIASLQMECQGIMEGQNAALKAELYDTLRRLEC